MALLPRKPVDRIREVLEQYFHDRRGAVDDTRVRAIVEGEVIQRWHRHLGALRME